MNRSQRLTVGLIMIAHALAHSLPGMRALDGVSGWLTGQAGFGGVALELTAAGLLAVVMASLMAAGFGALGTRPFSFAWRRLAVLGSGASLIFLLTLQPPLMVSGALVSATLLGIVPWLGDGFRAGLPIGVVQRWSRRVSAGFAVLVVGYIGVAVASRPWHQRWGSTAEELRASLPGDEMVDGPVQYAIQHAVTIEAPPHAVWPWLVQIGQDRAGFYSHDWLERLFGADIRNVDVIVPEWQHRAVGDSVFATQAGYLGVFESRLGWRVARVDPGRALVLEKWGAFVLTPHGNNASRLIVRTRGGGNGHDSLIDVLLGPAGLLAFELPHFIMERGMLLGIKERAEAAKPGAPMLVSKGSASRGP
jgi:hypothetical protein